MLKQGTENQFDAPAITAVSPSGAASIAKRMLQVMKKVGYVQKDGKNDFHGYKYASEANLIAALRPELINAGLVLIPSVTHVGQDEHGNTHVQMTFTILDEEGNTFSFTGAGSGNDKARNGNVGDKGIYKAITGATKYALMKTFLLETGDDPEVASDHDRHEPAPKAAPKAEPKPKASLNEDQVLLINALKEFAGNMGSPEELKELWGENLPKLEEIERIDPAAHEDLKNHFRNIRDQLKGSK